MLPILFSVRRLVTRRNPDFLGIFLVVRRAMSHSDVRPWTLQCLWRVMAHYDSVQVQFADFIWSQVLVWRPDSIMGSGRGFCMASMKLVGYPSSGCVLFNSFWFHCLIHIVLYNLIGDSQVSANYQIGVK